MKKSHRIFLWIVLLVVAGFFVFVLTRQEFLGVSTPEPQTEDGIRNFALENHLGGSLFVEKDASSRPALNQYFSYGMIYVFGVDSNLINGSLESYGGDGYMDIENELCAEAELQPKRMDNSVKGNKIFKIFLENTRPLNSNFSWKNYKYIVVYSWAKYAKGSYNAEALRFLKCISDNPDYQIICLNTDEIIRQ